MLLLFSGLEVWAQDGFDPGMPPEPEVPKLPLTVTCEPSGAGTVSGAGNYTIGTQVTIKTTPKQFYTFSHWTLNGEQYSTDQSFQYTTTDGAMAFVAVYTKDPTCVVTTKCEPTAAGSASGAGTYAVGGTVNVKTSGNVGYIFSHWTLNGEVYSTSTSLSYTAEEGEKNFVAVYEYDPTFNPELPPEPSLTLRSRLFLQSDPAGICTFNRTSGDYAEVDKSVTVKVTGINQGYDFVGWYLGDEQFSTSKSFDFMMTYEDATLTARFTETPPEPEEPEQPFNPDDPSEPESQGGDIHNIIKGDVNGDKIVDIDDALCIVNYLVGKSNSTFVLEAADVNGDGVVDIADAVYIVNFVVGKINALAPKSDLLQQGQIMESRKCLQMKERKKSDKKRLS